jgi:drug/metabolite transporter (DMT)-like permease
MCAAILCFSSSSVLIRKAEIPGATTAFWRLVFANPVWWVVIWVTERRLISLADLRRALLPGIFFGLNIVIFFEGVNRTSIANAEFIGALTPLLVIPAGALIYKERILPRALSFGLVSLAGLALVVFNGPASGASSASGNLIIACATFSWSGYLLSSRRLRGTMTVARIMGSVMPIATLTALPIVIARDELTDLTAHSLPYVLGLVVLTGTLAHGFIVLAQQSVPVGTISLLQVSQPALAVVWAYFLLDQELRAIQIVGMALVIAGLVAVVTMSRRAAPLPEAVEVPDQ